MYSSNKEWKYKSDNDLLSLFYSGESNALSILFSRYKNKICFHIYSYVKSKELTEDIYQDIIYKILLHLKEKKYTEKGKFYAWMLRVTKNHLIDYYRTHKNKKHVSYIINDDDEDINIFDILRTDHVSETDFSKEMIRHENKIKNKNIIKELINSLPQEQKEVVILRMYYDMSFKEIAQYSNVSINTSLGRMRYALINLEKMIKEKCLFKELLCG